MPCLAYLLRFDNLLIEHTGKILFIFCLNRTRKLFYLQLKKKNNLCVFAIYKRNNNKA